MTTQPFNPTQALEKWTALQRRIEAGSYQERFSYHHETGTWPDDGVEESLDNLEEQAAAEGLEFIWHKDTRTWSLEHQF